MEIALATHPKGKRPGIEGEVADPDLILAFADMIEEAGPQNSQRPDRLSRTIYIEDMTPAEALAQSAMKMNSPQQLSRLSQ
jgi:hypothetical protein